MNIDVDVSAGVFSSVGVDAPNSLLVFGQVRVSSPQADLSSVFLVFRTLERHSKDQPARSNFRQGPAGFSLELEASSSGILHSYSTLSRDSRARRSVKYLRAGKSRRAAPATGDCSWKTVCAHIGPRNYFPTTITQRRNRRGPATVGRK